jgi:hypothetical protein
LLATLAGAAACDKEDNPLVTVDAEVQQPDLPPVPDAPEPEHEIAGDLPGIPANLPGPGALATALTTLTPRPKPSPYTGRVLVQHRTEGPYRMVTWLVSADGSTVESVTVTLDPAYNHPTRWKALRKAFERKMGKGERVRGGHVRGAGWKTPDYRLELRRDRTSKDVELHYHRRGARELNLTQPKK